VADTASGEEHIVKAMRWHFSTETGSPFWLRQAKQFDFDPIADIRTWGDLRRFGDVSADLRTVAADDLFPRGLAGQPIAGIFESGGTTGGPKRVVVFEEWLRQLVEWRLAPTRGHDGERSLVGHTLAIIPTGPHLVGAINQVRARALGGLLFTIDLDPRWVKSLVGSGERSMAAAYAEHLIDQAESIVTTQNIRYLIATPPLLERIAHRPALVRAINRTCERITWGGTQMDPDTLEYLRDTVFADVEIQASYGSTMILGEARSRIGADHEGSPIFDTFSPYISFDVIAPETGETVPIGQRGRVVMNHVSRFALYPNVLERDTAIRLPAPVDQVGDSVADIRPVGEVAGVSVIEGVY
jgi:hypothetical protein